MGKGNVLVCHREGHFVRKAVWTPGVSQEKIYELDMFTSGLTLSTKITLMISPLSANLLRVWLLWDFFSEGNLLAKLLAVL